MYVSIAPRGSSRGWYASWAQRRGRRGWRRTPWSGSSPRPSGAREGAPRRSPKEADPKRSKLTRRRDILTRAVRDAREVERRLAQYEKHWLKIWNERRIFESESVPGRKKAFVTFPFPYMNGPLHIGHCFTATRVDIYARFKRMQGYNVLFPWAWHWTGESIPGMSYRLSQGDEGVRKAFLEIDGVPEKEVERFVDPEYLASYYTRVSREAVKDTGFSIDWRREFRTVDPAFKKFIDWQYLRLRELGYVVQGTHPVVWCSHDESPTGDHDRMEGEGVSPEEFNLLKFEVEAGEEVARRGHPPPGDDLRGDQRLGAPHGQVRRGGVDGEAWIVSPSAVSGSGSSSTTRRSPTSSAARSSWA